jgi:hypothetical protein
MTNDKIRLLTTDELESVGGGDYVPAKPCDVDTFKVGGVTVLQIAFYCFW